MDNIALEVYILSCVLPLLAFVLLAIQFYCSSPPHKPQNASSLQLLEEFPCHMGGLISIANQFHDTNNYASRSSKGSECIAKSDGTAEGQDHKKLRVTKR